MAADKAALGKAEDITRAILVLRGRRVLLDADLAVLYGVTTLRLNERVRRNRERFPDDFLFELTTEEFANLKPRFATSSWGGRRTLLPAFTEHGAIQAATIGATADAVIARKGGRRRRKAPPIPRRSRSVPPGQRSDRPDPRQHATCA